MIEGFWSHPPPPPAPIPVRTSKRGRNRDGIKKIEIDMVVNGYSILEYGSFIARRVLHDAWINSKAQYSDFVLTPQIVITLSHFYYIRNWVQCMSVNCCEKVWPDLVYINIINWAPFSVYGHDGNCFIFSLILFSFLLYPHLLLCFRLIHDSFFPPSPPPLSPPHYYFPPYYD